MRIFKKNQIIIYVIVLMIMTAGYLNYTANVNNQTLETGIKMEAKDDMQIANIGDATLVNSNDITNTTEENSTNQNTANLPNENNSNQNITNTVDNNSISKENITNDDKNNNTREIVEENKTEQTSSNNINQDEYFIKSKLERETMYSQMIGNYEKILNSQNSLEMQKQTATQEIQKINETRNSIMICENLIKTKGFENSIIFVNGDSINIIIGANEIKQEEIAQIQNIISREMNAEIENIHISTK